MIEFIEAIFGNWADIVVAITALVTAASVIVKLTPSVADDKIVGKIQSVLAQIALNKVSK